MQRVGCLNYLLLSGISHRRSIGRSRRSIVFPMALFRLFTKLRSRSPSMIGFLSGRGCWRLRNCPRSVLAVDTKLYRRVRSRRRKRRPLVQTTPPFYVIVLHA